jgi:vacuolar protein sorting-associated protein IST1
MVFEKLRGKVFKPHKVKTSLSKSRIRMDLLRNKIQNNVAVEQRQIGNLLKERKDEAARIKVENVIRQEVMSEALQLLDTFCSLLLSKIPLITETKSCPNELKEAITTLLYGMSHVDVPDLEQFRTHITRKYGKEFITAAMENRDHAVNQRVMVKLNSSVNTPEPYLCVMYLKDVAAKFGITLEESTEPMQFTPPPPSNPQYNMYNDVPPVQPQEHTGHQFDFYPSISPQYEPDVNERHGPSHNVRISFIPPDLGFDSSIITETQFNAPPTDEESLPAEDASIPDFDELQMRFNQLKKL